MDRLSKAANARRGVALGEGSLIPFRQDIRFARTTDELRITYAVSGKGYPLVRAASVEGGKT